MAGVVARGGGAHPHRAGDRDETSGITIFGQYQAFYDDGTSTLKGENYTPASFMGLCHEPWYVTGPARTITISGVTGGGRGISAGTVSNLLLASQLRVGTC